MAGLFFVKSSVWGLHLYKSPHYAEKCERLLERGDILVALDETILDSQARINLGYAVNDPLMLVLSHLGVGWVNEMCISPLV